LSLFLGFAFFVNTVVAQTISITSSNISASSNNGLQIDIMAFNSDMNFNTNIANATIDTIDIATKSFIWLEARWNAWQIDNTGASDNTATLRSNLMNIGHRHRLQ